MEKLAYNNKSVLSIVDCETESLNLILSRPWEIAFCRSKNGKVFESYEAMIFWPDLNISKKAAEITRFDFDKYKRLARPPEEVWERLESVFYSTDIIGGHNVISFDWAIIRGFAKAIGKWRGWQDVCERTLDSLLLSRMYHDGRKPDRENLFASQLKEIGKPPRGSKKSTLAAMAGVFGIPVDATLTHSALYDVELNVKVMKELIYKQDL